MSNESNAVTAHDVTVRVQSVKGTRSYTVPQQTKVAELTAQAVNDFGLPSGDTYSMVRHSTGDTLDPDRPLVSFHLEQDEILTLSAVTGGA